MVKLLKILKKFKGRPKKLVPSGEIPTYLEFFWLNLVRKFKEQSPICKNKPNFSRAPLDLTTVLEF